MTTLAQPDGWSDRMDRALKDAEKDAAQRAAVTRAPSLGQNWHRTRLKPYKYIGCCVTLDEDLLNAMIEEGEATHYADMLTECDLVAFANIFGYARNTLCGHGGTLRADRTVEFFRSTYDGKPCYYLDHSRIEWVWVKR